MLRSRWEWLLGGVLVMMFQQGLSQDPVDGGFSEWTEWGGPACSVTCGTATRLERRGRTCTNPAPANGGSDCTGETVQTRSFSCGLTACPVNGGFSEWTAWTDPGCSVTCGETATKILSRERSCTNPAPAHGGSNCTGAYVESATVNCDLSGCPVDGGFTEWTEWGGPDCSVTCGETATRRERRKRSCTNPAPANGGSDCSGAYSQTRTVSCELTACPDPVDGGFSQWTEWGGPACSVTCGTATRLERRGRTCTNPAPANGGSTCTGAYTQIRTVSCGLTACPGDD